MANELQHSDIGTELTKAEWEGIGTHVLDSQATGDVIYASSSSQLTRLGIGSTDQVLTVAGGVPSWAAAPAAAAGSLTGSTLASGVTSSSLTTLGTIATGVWQGTDVGVAHGGTGASTLTANGVLIGNGTGAVTAVDQSTKGHILIGDGSANPQMLAVGSNDEVLTADSGETTGVKWAAAGGGGAAITPIEKPMVANSYVVPGWGWNSSDTTEKVAGTYFMPILVPDTIAFDRIAVDNTSGSGGTARLAVYNATTTGGLIFPSTLITDHGTVSLASDGIKEITISWTAAAGFYYLAYSNASAASVSTCSEANCYQFPVAGCSNSSSSFDAQYNIPFSSTNYVTAGYPADVSTGVMNWFLSPKAGIGFLRLAS